MKKELDELAEQYPGQFKVWYTVDRAEEGKVIHLFHLYPRSLVKKIMLNHFLCNAA